MNIIISSGVYQIQNLINGKCYIGSSKNLNTRKRIHFSDLKLNKHHNSKLQNAFNKYGEKNFEFSILEYINNPENLIKIEQFYIDFFDVVSNGYNIRIFAENNAKRKHNSETKTKISNALKGRKISIDTKNKMSISSNKKQQTNCKQGHKFTLENTLIAIRKTGRIRRNCKICTNLFDKNRYNRKKYQENSSPDCL